MIIRISEKISDYNWKVLEIVEAVKIYKNPQGAVVIEFMFETETEGTQYDEYDADLCFELLLNEGWEKVEFA